MGFEFQSAFFLFAGDDQQDNDHDGRNDQQTDDQRDRVVIQPVFGLLAANATGVSAKKEAAKAEKKRQKTSCDFTAWVTAPFLC